MISLLRITDIITRLFPLWAILGSYLAWQQPELFKDHKNLIVPLLSVVMFGMGLTLTPADFKRVLKLPGVIALGLFLQFSIMPLTALGLSILFDLGPELTIGMILVGACPGGTASNVICYLARGNVALSISLTAFSTLLSVILTPLIALLLAGTSVDVPAESMLFSIFTIVIIPVISGIILNHFMHRHLRSALPVFPAISVIAIVLIIAIIISLNSGSLTVIGAALLFAVMLHNLIGLSAAYLMAIAFRYDAVTARTLAIEVGMQNSGLAVALSIKYFSAAAAVPGAFFSVWHNLSGSLLASLVSRKHPE